MKVIFFKKNIADTTLREMCPNTESFLVRIFPHSDWIRRDTPYLSVFSPNAGKYWSEKTPYFDTFDAVQALKIESRIFTYPTNSSNSVISVQPILSDRNVSPKSKGNFAMKRTTAVKVMAPTKKKNKIRFYLKNHAIKLKRWSCAASIYLFKFNNRKKY